MRPSELLPLFPGLYVYICASMAARGLVGPAEGLEGPYEGPCLEGALMGVPSGLQGLPKAPSPGGPS